MQTDHAAAQSKHDGRGKYTGWAIATALALSMIFYVVYRIFFTFIVGIFADYDPSFATGFGALVLLVFGPNVLGVLCGAAVARKIFKRANATGMFYGVATFLVFTIVLTIVIAVLRHDTNWIAIIVSVAVIMCSIYAAKLIIFARE